MVRTFNYQRAKSATPISLLDFLTSSFKYHNAQQWSDVISNKHWVSVDNTIITDPNFLLPHQCVIGCDVPEELEPEVDDRMELIYLDDHLGVVVKSGNIPVSEGGRYSKRTLVKIAARKFLTTTNDDNDDDDGGGDQDENKKVKGKPLSSSEPSSSSSFTAVHRLDKETSGLVVMARNHASTVNLGHQFARNSLDENDVVNEKEAGQIRQRDHSMNNRDDQGEQKKDNDDNNNNSNEKDDVDDGKIEKEYTAVLLGTISQEQDIRLRIGNEADLPDEEKDTKNRKLKKFRMVCRPAATTTAKNADNDDQRFGKDARTVVTPIKSDKNLTLCRIKLFTGRTHQIRIHCASIGHPLVGDKMYLPGGGSVDCDQYLRRAKGEETISQKIFFSSSSSSSAVKTTIDEGSTSEASKMIEIHPSRHLLHASKLSFIHPISTSDNNNNKKMRMTFESNPEETFLQACPELKEFDLF